MTGPALPPHIAALLSPDAYPHKPDRVELRQTHISYVFLAGDLVYKIKKPLNLGFLDYSTLEKRKHYCEEEVRLNRRLCEATYLGVVPIVPGGSSLKLEGRGEPIEYAVKMRRLPEDGMMSSLLEHDAITGDMVADLARRLADFHASSERSEEIDRFGGLEAALLNWRENFQQTEPYLGRTITHPQFEEIRAFVENVAESDAELFARRVREGRVRDCHGDLRTDAVCFTEDHACVFDCIEFNDRFRYSDVAADIAFLAMDLEFRGRRDLSDELMGRYLEDTLDSTLPLLLPFYKCYRACVRGKVDGFQLDRPEIDEAQKAQVRDAAHRYFELAHEYATHLTPRTLMITVGVTGSGKSYLANALAARLGAAIFSSDATRKRLLGISATERRFEPFETGSYAPEITDRTYEALLGEARTWLERDKPVILDASFLARKHREAALQLALETETPFFALECEVDEATIFTRLSDRRGQERVVSDGRWEIYQAQQESREPVDELPFGSHVLVDTSLPLKGQLATVVDHVLTPAERP
jgi:aminoglycoside phosphotransferase family enzyme/predicted kinase